LYKLINQQKETSMAWDDAKKELAEELYKKGLEQFDTDEQRAEHTLDIVSDISEELGETVNSVRMLLVKRGVYVKKVAKAKPKTTSEGKATRFNKADAIQKLTNQIAAIDPEQVDEDILGKLTGKAANYFSVILELAIAE
jgi:uncharacterized protein YajQ (UPF0234 family)